MKRRLLLFLLIPILALVLVSCDGDMRSSFADFLGGFGGNVYGDIVKPDYSGVEEAGAAIDALQFEAPAVDGDGKAKIFGGIEIALPGEDDGAGNVTPVTILAPQGSDDQAALKNTVKEAIKTEDKKDKFAEEQKAPASSDQQKAASGTAKAINATIDAVLADVDANEEVKEFLEKLKLPEVEEENITKADVLILQLMTDMISNTVEALDDDDLSPEEAESLINDALFTLEIAETLSGASSIIFTDEISIFDLIPKDDEDDDRGARDLVPIEDEDGIFHGLRGLFPSMIKLMGVTRSGNNYSYSSKAYQSFIINQRAYRASMEQAVHLDGNNNTLKDKAKFSENTLIKYIISVLITENHEYLKSEDLQGDVIIAKLLNDNPSLGDKPSPSNKMTEFEDEAFSNYDENKLETFFKNTWEKATFEGILKTLRAINEGIAEKYRFDVVTEEIDKILDDLEDEDDNTWFKSVFGD